MENQASNKLDTVIPKFLTLKEIGVHKGMAKIGDAVTNLIYSIAKSRVLRFIQARNVNRTILSQALKSANLRDYAKTRADAHDLADSAEAFIGFVFCKDILSLDELVDILIQSLTQKSFDTEKEEIVAATLAFTNLLIKIKSILDPIFLVEIN
jgi:hypothetical protein